MTLNNFILWEIIGWNKRLFRRVGFSCKLRQLRKSLHSKQQLAVSIFYKSVTCTSAHLVGFDIRLLGKWIHFIAQYSTEESTTLDHTQKKHTMEELKILPTYNKRNAHRLNGTTWTVIDYQTNTLTDFTVPITSMARPCEISEKIKWMHGVGTGQTAYTMKGRWRKDSRKKNLLQSEYHCEQNTAWQLQMSSLYITINI
jgi:hypothetical protein